MATTGKKPLDEPPAGEREQGAPTLEERGKNVIDPFGTSVISDYSHLFEEFGIQSISTVLGKITNQSRYLRRGIDFAHRDLDKWLKNPEAAMSGIKPTGEFHLGSKMTAEELIYFQKEFGAKVYYCIADIEAFADNGISLEEGHEFAVGNVADLLALGLDPDNAYIYRQSEELRVLRLAYLFGKRVTLNTLKGLYGQREIGLYNSALIQAGDIMSPELDGLKNVLVPIGADQDPHIRLTRDLSQKFAEEYGFLEPACIIHKFFRALNGESKMSKRDPSTYLLLSDGEGVARQKVMSAMTGGRATWGEQQKLGGEADKCVIYELCKFHFTDNDKRLKEIHDRCVGGKIPCGPCKKDVFDNEVLPALRSHQEKRAQNLEKARKIVDGKTA